MIECRTELRVRYAETDMMGVVYHANFLAWFEVGRTELLRQHGLPYRTLEDGGYRLPVLEAQAKYLRPALYDDMVVITTRLLDKPTVRIRLDYEVHARGQLLATGSTTHAFINAQGEPVKPPAAFSVRMNELFAAPGGG